MRQGDTIAKGVTRMTRWLFHIISALSMSLCIASAVFRARSYRLDRHSASNPLTLVSAGEGLFVRTIYSLESVNGAVRLSIRPPQKSYPIDLPEGPQPTARDSCVFVQYEFVQYERHLIIPGVSWGRARS